MASGRNIRISANGDQGDENLTIRRACAEERAMAICGKGYPGRANYTATHFSATSDRWGEEGESFLTITPAISEVYGNLSRESNIPPRERGNGVSYFYAGRITSEGAVCRDIESARAQLLISIWYVWGISITECEIYRKQRTRAEKWKGATNNGSICIFVPTEGRSALGASGSGDVGTKLKLNREQTLIGRFAEPQYATRRASHLRGDLGDTNKLARPMMGEL